MTSWHRYTSVLALVAFVHAAGPRRASADVVLDWNAIADNTAIVNGQHPVVSHDSTDCKPDTCCLI
jgi:hypothetical protein